VVVFGGVVVWCVAVVLVVCVLVLVVPQRWGSTLGPQR